MNLVARALEFFGDVIGVAEVGVVLDFVEGNAKRGSCFLVAEHSLNA